MKIGLIGYGKMGQTIEKIALERGHEIVSIIEAKSQELFDSEQFKNADVAIEFTAPKEALKNYQRCFAHHIPVVSGTTGWLDYLPEVKKVCEEDSQTFFYASNFSLGVNIFFALNRKLAQMMNQFSEYKVNMSETHHLQKLDAPSGTAISLAEDLMSYLNYTNKWELGVESYDDIIGIEAKREADIPGIHSVIYSSDVDEISINHRAINRNGFALGAVIAAEYTSSHRGFLTMDEMLNL